MHKEKNDILDLKNFLFQKNTIKRMKIQPLIERKYWQLIKNLYPDSKKVIIRKQITQLKTDQILEQILRQRRCMDSN